MALALALRHCGTHLLRDLVTLVVLLLSLWGDVTGAVYGNAGLFSLCVSQNYAHNYLCTTIPRDSVLWYPFTAPQPLTGLNLAYLAYALVVGLYLAAPLVRALLVGSFTYARHLLHAPWQV